MLNGPPNEADDAWFASWRHRELSRVVRSGVAYLDYTGAALYPESLVRADAERLLGTTLGNPHSEHEPSRRASGDLATARQALLELVQAPPDEYTVILTANTTAACRLIGDSFPFSAGSVLLASADNHNSVNGVREFARQAGADIRTIALDDELRLENASLALAEPGTRPSLFAYPAQSNFSGVRHPLSLIQEARAAGWRVLLDAASYLPTSDLDLRHVKPDFVTLSLYKISGYPTGVGALVARREALAELRRPWFSGGTVKWASVQDQRHLLSDAPEGFEDGTPAFLAVGAVAPALAAMRALDRARLTRHLTNLTAELLLGMQLLNHGNSTPLVRIHGPQDLVSRGATVALSLHRPDGRPIPYWLVETAARGEGLAVRGGCFCNPGCAEAAFGFRDAGSRHCLDTLGSSFTIPGFADCLGDRTVGAIRVSMGPGSVRADVDRFLGFLARYTESRLAA